MPNNSSPREQPPGPGQGTDADERVFEEFAREQDPLDIEAAIWVVRKRNGLDAEGEAELQSWLDADPSHAGAFEDMDATFREVKQLPGDDVAALKAVLPERSQVEVITPRSIPQSVGRSGRTPAHHRPGPGWRRWLPAPGPLFPPAAAVALAFAVIGGGWLGWGHWRQMPTFEQAYITERGQQITVSLPDGVGTGSTLQLDTATRTEVSLYRDRREVRLTDGQAMLTVYADARRPLHVRVGPLRITVVGTRFSVRHTRTGLDAGQTVVSVEEGHVRVARAEGIETGRESSVSAAGIDNSTVDLTAGQSVVADDHGRIGPVTSVSPAAIAPWREGRLSFDQTPLAQAIAEFERYGQTGLVVRDPVVAALPVGGSYSLRQFRHFVGTLPQILPVRLVQHGAVTEVAAR